MQRINLTAANHLNTNRFAPPRSPLSLAPIVAVITATLFIATPAVAQLSYTFTSGPGGDGFTWPPSPTGMLDSSSFATPDDVHIYNDIGNNLFFDDQYQVAGNAPGISNAAMWGNPTSIGLGTVDFDLFFSATQDLSFNFAWSVGGAPENTPEEVYIYVEDFEGRATDFYWSLASTYTGLGGFDGYTDRISITTGNLFDDYFNVDGEQLVDIVYVSIYVGDIDTGGGPSSEFAIDNFDLDGGIGGGGEVFPSVNNGSIDVTGSTLGRTSLRGAGNFTGGLEVTNGTLSTTTFSTQLLPGGDLSDAGQVNGATIFAGQSIYTPNLVSIDRLLPSASYSSDLRVINDLNASDPDNDVTLLLRLAEAPQLSAPSPVDVSLGEKVTLANAAAPVNGHRASVEVTGSSISGPFSVTGYDLDAPCKPGEMIEGDAAFDRFGRLSGNHNGLFTVSLQMTFYVNQINTFLENAEPVADEQWTLEAALADIPSDNASYDSQTPLGPGRVGVNSASTAATIVGGITASTGNVSMNLAAATTGSSTGVLQQSAAVSFTTASPVYAIQMTYRDEDICPSVTESNLRLLYFNSGAADWQLAVNGNSDGGSGATFFAGSFDAFVATLGGAPLSSALGTHGVDPANNHAWAIVDHAADFGVGEVGQSCGVKGDLDNNGIVNLDDYVIWQNCLEGPGIIVPPACAIADCDADQDVDLSDFAIFAESFGI
ncbi:MAG: hypothetical protein R3E58_17990 [Phycisphaerae bacterium]